MLNLDVNILIWITENIHGTWISGLFYLITILGNGGFLWLCTALYFKVKRKSMRDASMIVLALLISSFVVDVLIKNIFQRQRPFAVFKKIVPAFIEPSSYSFPSGHSATSFACASMIGRIDTKYRKWAFLSAFLIALSRVILCVHYPSDIAAGALCGIAIGEAIYGLMKEKL